MLEWLAAFIFCNAFETKERRIRQRSGRVALGWAYRLLRAMVIVRALALAGVARRPRPRPLPRNTAPAGFRRRVGRSHFVRAGFGRRAHKALRARDAFERIRLLIAAFKNLDSFARRYVVARMRRGLTRIDAIVMHAPPAEAVRALAAPTPAFADTS